MKAVWNISLAAMSLAMMSSLPLSAADATAPQTGQHAATFEKQVSMKLDYLLSLPPTYNDSTDKKWPLILFLHGSGERGSDVNKVKAHGPPKIIDHDANSDVATQFIVVSPQCPEGRWWKSDELEALLDDVQARYRVDADRVYLTGLSMGGFGSWDLAASAPKRFAAVAPMCGGGRVEMARRLKNLPIWVFHGQADPTVPVQRSEEMVAALKKLNADIQFTCYPGVGHDCWTRSYDNAELYKWFLSHKRGEKPAGAAATPKESDKK